MASRVVPGWSNAITRSSPSSALMSVDLPTLGRPAMATRGMRSASSSSSASSGNSSSASSTRLRTPSPCAAEIGCGSPRPSSWKSAVTTPRSMPSTLLTANNTGRLIRRSSCAMSLSSGVIPSRPSTTKIMRSASWIACSVWRAISCLMPSRDLGSKPPVSIARKPLRPILPWP